MGSDDIELELDRVLFDFESETCPFPGFIDDIAAGIAWVGISSTQYRPRSSRRLLKNLQELSTISIVDVKAVGPYSASYAPKVATALRLLSTLLEHELRRRCYFVDTRTGELMLIGSGFHSKVRYSLKMVERLHVQP